MCGIRNSDETKGSKFAVDLQPFRAYKRTHKHFGTSTEHEILGDEISAQNHEDGHLQNVDIESYESG